MAVKESVLDEDTTQVALVGGSAEGESALRLALGDGFELCSRDGEGRPAGAVVHLDGPEVETGLQAIARLFAATPDLPIVALGRNKDPELILRAMRAGAREFLLAGDVAAQAATLRGILQQRRPSGVVIACLPTRGGIGATTIAVNLAGELAEQRRVVVVDLELFLGDVLLFLDLEAGFCLSDLLANQQRMDRSYLLSSLPRHSSGLYALGAGNSWVENERPSAASIAHLLACLRRYFHYVVLDGLHAFDEVTLDALDLADQVLMVLAQDLPSTKNAQRCFDLFRRLGYDSKKIRLVLNRAVRRGGALELETLIDHLGAAPEVTIVSDYPTVVRAIQRGRLLREESPRATVTRDLAALADRVAGVTRRRRGLFDALLQRVSVALSASAPAATRGSVRGGYVTEGSEEVSRDSTQLKRAVGRGAVKESPHGTERSSQAE